MRRLLTMIAAMMLAAVGVVPGMAQEDEATFRVAHLSADAGAVDIYVDGEALLEGVEFGTVSDWMTVPAGSYAVDIAPVGTSAEDAVLSADIELESGDTFYTAAAVGYATREDVYPLELQIVEENYGAQNPAESRLTVFHAIPTVQPVSVIADDTTLVSGLSFRELVNNNADGVFSTDIVAGTYDLTVEFTESGETLFDLPETTLTANRNYFIAAAGLPSDPQLIFVSTNPNDLTDEMDETAEEEVASGTANLRIAHFSEDAPAVDVYVDGEAVLEAVEYPAISNFLELDSGTYTVDIVPAGESIDAAVISEDVTLEAGMSYTAAAIGLVSRPDITPLQLQLLGDNYSEIAPGETRFSIFHASPGAPPVDIIVNDQVFVASLAYPGTLGENDGYIDFDIIADTYDITVSAAGAPETVLIDLAGTELAPGNQYFIAAINSPDNINFFLTSEER